MWKRMLMWTLCLLAALCLMVSASAAGGESPPGHVEIANRNNANGAFSCDVNLSGGEVKGSVFAVLFAESGQMKRLSVYPAAEIVQVELAGVDDTDYIRIVWIDENQIPLASPAMLRMSGNGASAYAQFAEELMEMQEEYGDIGGGAASGDEDPYVLARLLVSCTELPDLSAYNVASMATGPDNLYVLQFHSAEEARKCAEYLQTCPTVRYAEPDGLVYADGAELQASVPPSWGAEATGVAAYADNLRQRGRNSTIVVAVVDSGADMTHPLLKDRLVPGCDFVKKDNDPQDEHGHGTHVSGIVANCTPDMNVKIMPVRVLDAYGSGNALRISTGIRYAADNGANVINLSLSLLLGFHNPYLEEAIDYAVSKNITVVAAAGNKNSDVKDCCPAHMAECVTVAAVDKEWKRFELSNYGNGVDIAAPGVDVNSSLPGGKYGDMTGTSMAAPHVAAAAALLMEERGTAQTPAQISSALKDSASSLPGANVAGEAVRLGAGFLNLTPFIIQPQRTISFYPNDGTGSMTPQSAASGAIVALKANTFTRNGYQFTGWNTIADGSGTAYKDGATLTVTENLPLYAQWEQESTLYALLYSDGTLTFQNGDTPQSGKTVTKTYEVDLNAVYEWDSDKQIPTTPWYNERQSVKVVNLAGKISPKATAYWFYDCENLKRVDNIQNLDTANVKDMSGMFAYCSGLTALDVSHFDTANVKDMGWMFFGCSGLTALDVSHFDTANVKDMHYMFRYCSGLTALDVSHFDTANVKDMYGMFWDCSGLTALDVSHFDTANVTNMLRMFNDCSGLTALDLSHFDTANVKDMGWMFYGCSGLTALDVSHFDTANVTNMPGMFDDCSGLTALDVSHFDTANVIDMRYMFSDCSGLKTIYASDKFTTASVSDSYYMFNACTSLVGGAGTKFDSSHTDKEYARIDGGASAPGYFTAK